DFKQNFIDRICTAALVSVRNHKIYYDSCNIIRAIVCENEYSVDLDINLNVTITQISKTHEKEYIYFGDRLFTYANAGRVCSKFDARIVQIRDFSETLFLKSLICAGGDFWLGAQSNYNSTTP